MNDHIPKIISFDKHNTKTLIALLIFMVFTVKTVSAQSPLELVDLTPQVGDQFIMTYCSNFNGVVSSGMNVVWDYSSAFVDSGTDTIIYEPIDTGLVTVGGIGELSDLQLTHSQTPQHEVIGTRSDRLDMLAYTVGNYVVGSPGLTYLKFPVSFGQVSQSPFEFTPTFAPWYALGTGYIEVNGFGDLILPSGTYNDVYKVQLIKDGTHVNTDVYPPIETSHLDTLNLWFKKDIHHPLLAIHTNHWLRDFTVHNTIQYLTSYGYASIDDPIRPQFNVHPNPAIKEIHVQSNLLEGFSYKLINSLGEEVDINQSSSTVVVIDCDGYPPGIYFLQLESKNCLYVEKIILR